ncbi:MAG TPA: aldo/keto reductase [Mycobacteriales bacterium]|jgi:aryl-alcohol dehydrogenase-like predicted oxidoreductase|nr:aldo/keto reductase [Mycobacteriales bacterium]
MQQRIIGSDDGRRTVSALCLGAMWFGTKVDRATSEAILDRFVEAGGTFIDTADNYNQWVRDGGESETLLGSWMADRGNRDQLVISTKCGAKTTVPGDPSPENFEGLAAPTIRRAVGDSLRRLQIDRIDLYYAHIDDRATPIEETVGAMGGLVNDGTVASVGCSNHATWRLEQARNAAAALGVPAYSAIQQEYTYLWPRAVAGRAPVADPEMLDYLTVHEEVTLIAYSPLLSGSYGRAERPLPAHRGYAHPSAQARYQVLREVSADLDATPNQVALAWLLRHQPTVIPVFGASTVEQLDEALGALDVKLDDETAARLDVG